MLQAFYTATVGAQQQMERMGVQGNNLYVELFCVFVFVERIVFGGFLKTYILFGVTGTVVTACGKDKEKPCGSCHLFAKSFHVVLI